MVLAILVLSGCSMRQGPDLAAIYNSGAGRADQPPLVIIPGMMGTSLNASASGAELWPGSLPNMAFSDYAHLARIGPERQAADTIAPGALIRTVAGIDIYGRLLDALVHAGGFVESRPGQAVTDHRQRRFYTLAYDWRLPNIVAVRQLHDLIEQIRRDFDDPALRVDIIAHSNGGLIANYYLRYGPDDVLDDPDPQVWTEGAQRLRRLALLGTPNLGATASLQRLKQGFRFKLRTVPVEAVASFATVFETLPHPLSMTIFDRHGRLLAIDLYDANIWRDNRWSVYSPEVEARVLALWPGPQGQLVLTALRSDFERHLRRARQTQQALTLPFPLADLRIAAFGGDCEPTLAGAVLETSGTYARLAFSPGEIRQPAALIDYAGLLKAPGDGLVTRASQDAAAFGFVPLRQSFYLCENHGRLLANLAIQNNLMNFILGPQGN